MLQHEMPVQQDRLYLGHEAVVAIQVGPARLHHADRGIGKVVDDLHQPVRGRHKVGIEDRDQLAARRAQPLIQRARLVSMAIGAMQMHNRLRRQPGKAPRIAIHNLLRYADRLVGRVVQHLDLEAVARILDPAHRVDQPVDHELFIEDRQLNGNERQPALGVSGSRLVPLRRLLLVVVVQPHQLVAMDSIERQNHHHHEVRDQHRRVEQVPPIQAAKGVVRIVRVQVVAESLGGQKHRQRGMQLVQEGWQGNTPQQGCRSLTILREGVTQRARLSRLPFAYAKYIR